MCWSFRTRSGVPFIDRIRNEKGPREAAPFFCLVEAAGIEPASASPTSLVLHA